MSLEGLVSGTGCGVLSEGKAEGINPTGGARVRGFGTRACGLVGLVVMAVVCCLG